MTAAKQTAKRKGGGGKLARSETVTVRFDPRLRYLADLAARRQRRTLSSYIEWAVEESLFHVVLRGEDGPLPSGLRAGSVGSLTDELWDIDEADRLVKLALSFPDLLTHAEQIMWKLIRESGAFWLGAHDDQTNEWTWRIDRESLNYPRVREYFEQIRAVGEGHLDRSDLPAWLTAVPKLHDDDATALGSAEE